MVSSECTMFRPLKNSTFRKHLWKSEHLKSFIEFEINLDLWKIPLSENIDEISNFSRVSSKCTKYKPLIRFTLRKYRWKIKLLKGFIENVLCVDLWKNSHTWEISMKVQTPQGFHQKCTKCGPLKNSTLGKYWWKIKLLKSFIENVLNMNLSKNQHLENTKESPNSSKVSSKRCTKCGPLENSTLRK